MVLLQLRGVRTVKNREGQTVVMSRKARFLLFLLMVVNYNIMILNMVQYFLLKISKKLKSGTKLAEWDPNNQVILTEKAGTVKFVDLIENVTIQERFDEATNKSSKIILEHKE